MLHLTGQQKDCEGCFHEGVGFLIGIAQIRTLTTSDGSS